MMLAAVFVVCLFVGTFADTTTCGGDYIAETGSLSFPVFAGESWPGQSTCAWKITTTPGKTLVLTFKSFHMNKHPQCLNGSLQIFDGPSASSNRLGTYCGYYGLNAKELDSVFSTQNQLYFLFEKRANDSPYSGFEVEWKSQPDSDCGGEYTGERGTFGYPVTFGSRYPNNARCGWKVTTTPGKVLNITFMWFTVDSSINGCPDSLQIYDGPDASSNRLGEYCGYSSPHRKRPIVSSQNQLYFRFQSDATNPDPIMSPILGFYVEWKSVASP